MSHLKNAYGSSLGEESNYYKKQKVWVIRIEKNVFFFILMIGEIIWWSIYKKESYS